MSPDTLSLFHITAIPNLSAMAALGAILAKNELHRRGLAPADIAHQSVQGRRANKAVEAGPGGVVHNYVPFYFAPRSPMLMTINGGNVPGCPYRQDDIAHLRINLSDALRSRLRFAFYNQNAAIATAECFDDIADLDKIDWPLFFEQPCLDGYCKWWNSTSSNPRYVRRMETRQAEFLIHLQTPLALVAEVVVRTPQIAAGVRQTLSQAGWRVPVRAQPLWYF